MDQPSNGYALGIDLGTTFTAAAIVRDGRAEVVTLGTKTAAIPSVVFVKEDLTVLVGESAIRRGATDPSRVAREFKRRLGDPAPILLGRAPFAAEALIAHLLRWTVDAVTEREGGAPQHIAVSHPANWGPYKLDLLMQAVRIADVRVDRYLTEPEAAAMSWAATERVADGTVVAVYDLGGGTFDAAVLRKREHDFEILGDPEGIERLGGIDFDQALLAHVADALGGTIGQLDPLEPSVLAALARLRQDVVDGKEALSLDTDTEIPVLLPNLHTDVRVTRAEFEAMIRPTLAGTIAALRRALRSANVSADGLGAVVLVGGSSRIPLVAELVGEELGRPIAVDAHPKHAVALGAALAAARGTVAKFDGTRVVKPAPVSTPPAPTVVIAKPPAEPRAPIATAFAVPSAPGVPRRRARRTPLIAAAAVVVVVVSLGLGVGGFVLGGRGDSAGAIECPAAPSVCITDVRVTSGQVFADFAPNGVTLGDPFGTAFGEGTVHPAFFFRAHEAEARPWGSNSPFGGTNAAGMQGFASGDSPSEGSDLCVLLADAAGSLVDGTGNCVRVPTGDT